jgi:hypothetical protein
VHDLLEFKTVPSFPLMLNFERLWNTGRVELPGAILGGICSKADLEAHVFELRV